MDPPKSNRVVHAVSNNPRDTPGAAIAGAHTFIPNTMLPQRILQTYNNQRYQRILANDNALHDTNKRSYKGGGADNNTAIVSQENVRPTMCSLVLGRSGPTEQQRRGVPNKPKTK